MTEAQQLDRLEELFFAALELPEARRTDFLERACGADADLRAAVERMLQADQQRGGPIDDASWRAARLDQHVSTESEVDPGADAGAVIGGYRLLERIGVGGMGAVWRARRADADFERTVAVKLIKRGMDSDEILRRFRLERQVLARLEHPHIARLYDGGATDDGRPYLVMEYIDGVPIGRHCTDRGLSIEQILELFRAVCSAVHFAHSQLVLHRDIKPGNVLVTAEPQVKLLDFGIAKLLTDDGGAATVTTDHPVLTPRYASPEQIRGERLTTASDVYSLGVLLYELLTGQSPYEPRTGTRREIEHAVLSDIPAPPSVAVTRSTRLAPGARRALARRLRGDLDSIIAKALAKSPAERYASAEQMAEDIRRHQEGLPLLARGPGIAGRIARTLRRNRRSVIVASLAAVAALTIGVAAVSYWFMAPRWAQERVRQAQRVFLTPELSNNIWVLAFNNSDRPYARVRDPACAAEVANDALAAYDAALRFDPGLADVRIERDTVWLAAAISAAQGEAPAIPPGLLRSAPRTCAYATGWALGGAIPELSDEQLNHADPIDLRCLGLLAVLCGDARDCLRAWSRLGEFESDPLVEALLGVLYLADDQAARAYPRLLSAYRAYPDLGFLCTYLADAAISVGDVALAGRLLERAARLDHADPIEAHHRVRIRYHLALGQEEAAARVFAEPTRHINPVTHMQYARHLFDAGQQRRALGILGSFAGGNPSDRRVPDAMMRALFVLTQRWWTEMDEAARRETLAGAFDEAPEDFESVHRILDSYRVCQKRAARFFTQRALEDGSAPLAADGVLDSDAHREIEALWTRLGIENVYRWTQFRHYPPELRAQQLDVWLSADDPAARAREIDEAYALLWQDRQDEPAGYLKLLPPSPAERSFGCGVDIDGDCALVQSRTLAVFRRAAGSWQREPIEISPAARVVDAALDQDRILALLEHAADGELPDRRIVLFRRDPDSNDWRATTSEITLPPEAERPDFVGLSGELAFVATGTGDSQAEPVHLFHASTGDEPWRLEQSVAIPDAERFAYRPRPELAEDTLVLHARCRDWEAPCCCSVLFVYRRSAAGAWHCELQLEPPEHLTARAAWFAAACSEDRLLVGASTYGNAPAAALIYHRSADGQWRLEADLTELIVDGDRRTYSLVALHGSLAALAEFEHLGTVRLTHLFERGSGVWQASGAFPTPDYGYSDNIRSLGLTRDWLILGAPGHDAAGIDAGAAYISPVKSTSLGARVEPHN